MSLLLKYDYGIPFQHTYLGESVFKPTTDTSVYNRAEPRSIYSSFGKGNKLSLGIKFKYIQDIPFVLLFTYHLPSKINIERKLQQYDDSYIWEYSFFNLNFGIEFNKYFSGKSNMFMGIYPGVYFPLKINKQFYNTLYDRYFIVISDIRDKFNYELKLGSCVGLFSSLGFEQYINKNLSIIYSLSPEFVIVHSEYYNDHKISFSSLKLSIGLLIF